MFIIGFHSVRLLGTIRIKDNKIGQFAERTIAIVNAVFGYLNNDLIKQLRVETSMKSIYLLEL